MKVKLLWLQESWNWQASSLTLKSVIDTLLIQEFSRMVYTHPERLQKKWKYFVPTSCIAFIQKPVGQSYVTINQIIWNDIIVWSNESIIANQTQMTLPYDIILETDQLAYLPIERDPFSHRFWFLVPPFTRDSRKYASFRPDQWRHFWWNFLVKLLLPSAVLPVQSRIYMHVIR